MLKDLKIKLGNHAQFLEAWDAFIKLGYHWGGNCTEPCTAAYLYTYEDGRILADYFDVEGADLCSPNTAFGYFTNHKNQAVTLEELKIMAYGNSVQMTSEQQEAIEKLLETRIPILDQIYDLCLIIEECGASPKLTEAVTKAGALRDPISELVKQAVALGIGHGIVSVSHSDEGQLPMVEIQKDSPLSEQNINEVVKQIATLGNKPPVPTAVNCGESSGTVGEAKSCSGNVSYGNTNHRTIELLLEILRTTNVGGVVTDKARAKLSELVDKI